MYNFYLNLEEIDVYPFDIPREMAEIKSQLRQLDSYN